MTADVCTHGKTFDNAHHTNGDSCFHPFRCHWRCDEEPAAVPAERPAMGTALVLAEISRIIDASYPPTIDPELHLRRRLGKVGVENGEMLDALEGYTGENVRKGVYDTPEHVIKELLDCASAALCAVEHMTGNKGLALGMFAGQVQGNLDRLNDEVAHRA